MNIIKRKMELEWEGKEYEMYFDIASIPVFKSLTGKPFLQCAVALGEMDEEIILPFMGAIMREKHNLANPIGDKIYNEDMNILGLLLLHASDVVNLVTSSMPQSKGGRTEKK